MKGRYDGRARQQMGVGDMGPCSDLKGPSSVL